MVNGTPGTGKTLFTIRSLDILERDGDVLYVSTRVDKDTVHEMYIEDHTSLKTSHILDLSQDPFDIPYNIDVPFDKLDLDSLLDWINQIQSASKRITIAFDSWGLIYEYLAARQDNPPGIEAMTNQLVTLARQEDIRLVLVSEAREKPSLEYIVDGVVTLQVTEDERGRTRRHLKLEKLRGVRIGNRLHPVTLADGEFQAIMPVDLPFIRAESDGSTWESLSNSRRKFSTGIQDLDEILVGGYNRGSVVHLELGTDLSRDAWSVLTVPTIRNFISHELSTAVVPPREGSPGLLHNDLNKVLSSKMFERFCHVFETYAGPSQEADEYPRQRQRQRRKRVSSPSAPDSNSNSDSDSDEIDSPVKGGQLDYERYMEYVEKIRKRSEGPSLHIISMDTARPAFESYLGDFANYVALHNDLSILITKPGTDLRKRADRVADMHFKIERLGEAIVLYGENPLTPLLGVDLKKSQSASKITLTEMV